MSEIYKPGELIADFSDDISYSHIIFLDDSNKDGDNNEDRNETPKTKYTLQESQYYYKSSSNHCASDSNVFPSYRDNESGNW